MNPQRSTVAPQSFDPETWLDDYGDRLYGYAVRRVRDPQTAEDLVQETLLSAIKGIEGFSGSVDICSWLIGILRNKIFEHFRSQRREEIQGHEEIDPSIRNKSFDFLGGWKSSPRSWGSDPDAMLESKEFIERLQRCLSNLPSKIREIFVMHTFDGGSPAEIGAALNISESNLWVSLYRGRMTLRECIEKHWLHGQR